MIPKAETPLRAGFVVRALKRMALPSKSGPYLLTTAVLAATAGGLIAHTEAMVLDLENQKGTLKLSQKLRLGAVWTSAGASTLLAVAALFPPINRGIRDIAGTAARRLTGRLDSIVPQAALPAAAPAVAQRLPLPDKSRVA